MKTDRKICALDVLEAQIWQLGESIKKLSKMMVKHLETDSIAVQKANKKRKRK